MADTLIKNGIVITMDPDRRVLMNGAVAIEGENIIDVGESRTLEQTYKAGREIDAKGMVVMPGLFDAHGHAGHSLLKSLGMHNDTWYQACNILYAETSDVEFWEADAALTNLERLKFGTTSGVTFFGGGDSVMRVDDPVFARVHSDAVAKIGVRTFLAVGPRRPPYPRKYSRWHGEARRDFMVSFDEMIETCKTAIKENHGKNGGRVNIAMMYPTPHPERKPITGPALEDIRRESNIAYDLAVENDLMFTMDGHNRGTVKFCVEELGILGPNSLLSHSTELTQEEVSLCAEKDIRIAHNPSAVASIMGRCPVPELIDAGVKVALGSDAAGPDRSYDMFRHMFQAMRYHRRHYRDSKVLPPGKVLEMVTIDAAEAFNIADYTGSLEKGKKADVVLVDMKKPHLYPLNMPVDRITYFANGNDVDTVLVDGEIVMENRRATKVDEYAILEQANEQIEAAVGRSGLKTLQEIPDTYWGRSHY